MLCLRQSRRFLVLLVLEAVDYVFHHHIPDRAVHVETVSDRANRDVSIRDDPAQAITIAYGQCTDIENLSSFLRPHQSSRLAELLRHFLSSRLLELHGQFLPMGS